jgi:hypothetical protein
MDMGPQCGHQKYGTLEVSRAQWQCHCAIATAAVGLMRASEDRRNGFRRQVALHPSYRLHVALALAWKASAGKGRLGDSNSHRQRPSA